MCLDELQALDSQGHIDLYYGDESGFSLNCVIPYCWQFKDEPVLILPQRGKTINVLGFMKSTGDRAQLFMKEESIKATFVIECIQQLADSLTKPTVLVLDNARIHHAKIFQACMEEWEQQELYIFYLPTYSPHLNRIERLWKEAKYRWIPPSAYATLATLRQKLNTIRNRFGTDYRINFAPRKS